MANDIAMAIPVLTTKLTIPPRRSDWIVRLRLLNLMDAGLGRRLTLISAPAGSGKTTLAASWMHCLVNRKPAAACVTWLSLDPEDNDPVRFITHFVAALQKVVPAAGRAVQAFLKTPHVLDLNHLMTLIVNDLARHLEHPDRDGKRQIVLALDDFHVIQHTGLRSAMAYFLDHLPPHFHLLVVTREKPSFPLPRMRVRREMTEIRSQDLRFTGEETFAFLKRTMGLTLTAEEAGRLEDHTEGWVAGLQLAALSLRGRDEEGSQPAWQMDVTAGGSGEIIDYLAAEVLRRQSVEVREFLCRTSILDRFNADLCEAVTGRSDGREMLSYLERANLFLIPLDDQYQWYRYHHLFADFLRSGLTEQEQQKLHVRASRWLEAHDLTPEAIKHALAGHDYDTAVRLIRRGAEEACRVGAYSTLLGWVNALPEKVVRTHSDLLVHKGWILYLRGEIVTGEAYAALAVANQRPDDLSIHRGMLLSFRAYLAINRDEPERAVKLAEEALELLNGTESFYRTTALSYLGQAQRLIGDRQAAISTLRQTVALGQRLRHPLPTMEALGYLALLLYQQGELREALNSCEQAARQYLDTHGHPLPVAGLIYVPLGMLYYEINDLERAHYHLTTGISLCQQMGTIYATLAGQRTLIKLLYARGEVDAAWETLSSARELAARSENQRRIRTVTAIRAELQLRQGNTAGASMTLASLPDSAAERTEHENLTCARLLLAEGQPRAALELLSQIELIARRHQRFGSLSTVFLLQSIAHQALQAGEAALECMARAVSLAAPEGYRRVFLDEGSAIAGLLSDARHVAPSFIDELLASLTLLPTADRQGGSKPAPDLVERLSKTQHAILTLVADGLHNREIAARLAITEGTTKWHLNQIYGKLSVCSRTQAVARARKLKLL
ncbi:MAG: helix-turn-helix transcriptional regulator [Acidobacteriota bacterium]|nr:MAG: helix-turn-helix transcriptional regulator [Acidobacteriota bacterium]